jgi:hypothetical protein
MVLTFALALLFAGARGVRETVNSNLIQTVVFSLCNMVLGLAAAWAAVGLAEPMKRWPIVFLLFSLLRRATFSACILPKKMNAKE